MALPSATRLGPYEIVGQIGVGGTGEVYRARDPRLDRDVAIKVLPEDVASDAERLRRFEKEARAAGALNHPNVLAVYDVGAHDGRPYLVTELLEGETLRERMAASSLSVEKTVEYAVQIARGLAAAHDKGILHRDLKPENLFVTRDGLVKILDFGLSKLRGPQEQAAEIQTDAETASRTTDTGAVIGTAGYMSPEQVRGQAVDHRSDIYSFGTVLYEMLSGQRAFRGDSGVEVLNAILKEEPPEIDDPGRGVPPQLIRILKRCLEKRPEDRFQSARDLEFDLGPVWGSAGSARRQRSLVTAVATATALLAVTIGFMWLKLGSETLPGPAAPTERKTIVVLPFENLGSPEDEYFAAGTTEEVTNRLARVGGLGVISRTSAVQYDTAGKTIKQIGADLGVDFVLEGTVRWDPQGRGAGRVRISPRLVRVTDDTHLWAESYDRTVGDIFAVQSEIAETVVRQLGLALPPEERRALEASPTESLDAHRAYLTGLDHYHTPDPMEKESLEIAVRMFERAVEADPGFVPASRTSLSPMPCSISSASPTPKPWRRPVKRPSGSSS